MQKTILITGSTDGIGLETARMLASMGHRVLLHGRNPEKLDDAKKMLSALAGDGGVESYLADLSGMTDVDDFAHTLAEKHKTLDVLINNAGVLNAPHSVTQDGIDVRFAVNTIAPYLLTKRLLPLLGTSGRVINVSSAAQTSVDLEVLAEPGKLSVMKAYAQSKLALTLWSCHMARSLDSEDPVIIVVNPGSMLGSKMVKEVFGTPGGDIGIGAEILVRAALEDEFADASGKYYDNDKGRFSSPHPDALDHGKCEDIIRAIDKILAATLSKSRAQN